MRKCVSLRYPGRLIGWMERLPWIPLRFLAITLLGSPTCSPRTPRCGTVSCARKIPITYARDPS
eukprot:6192160-Prorocentrum_lima.AAC.1